MRNASTCMKQGAVRIAVTYLTDFTYQLEAIRLEKYHLLKECMSVSVKSMSVQLLVRTGSYVLLDVVENVISMEEVLEDEKGS